MRTTVKRLQARKLEIINRLSELSKDGWINSNSDDYAIEAELRNIEAELDRRVDLLEIAHSKGLSPESFAALAERMNHDRDRILTVLRGL